MMVFIDNTQTKIRQAHLERCAFIYIHQSSYHQVEPNLGSQRRQYDLASLALELGWSKEQVHVIDEDQGKSGPFANTRSGFGQLVAAVARGEAGIVTARSRNPETMQGRLCARLEGFSLHAARRVHQNDRGLEALLQYALRPRSARATCRGWPKAGQAEAQVAAANELWTSD